jgi:hypothetical protein
MDEDDLGVGRHGGKGVNDRILPFLALNWRAQRSFQIQGALPRYQGVFHYAANLELGYEF